MPTAPLQQVQRRLRVRLAVVLEITKQKVCHPLFNLTAARCHRNHLEHSVHLTRIHRNDMAVCAATAVLVPAVTVQCGCSSHLSHSKASAHHLEHVTCPSTSQFAHIVHHVLQ